MLAKLSSYTLIGIEAAAVEVEVDVSSAAMPKTVLVGLAEAAVRESTHRVERALVNSGYRRPIDRVVINLAPARLRRDSIGRMGPLRVRPRPSPGSSWPTGPWSPHVGSGRLSCQQLSRASRPSAAVPPPFLGLPTPPRSPHRTSRI